MSIAAFLTYRVEFIKKQNARLGTYVIKQLSQSGICLAQVAANKSVVTDHHEWQIQGLGYRLSKRRLTVAWGARQQHSMSWVISVGPQHISTRMFFHQLPTAFTDRETKQKLVHLDLWLNLNDRVAAVVCGFFGNGKKATRRDRYVCDCSL